MEKSFDRVVLGSIYRLAMRDWEVRYVLTGQSF